MNMYTSTYATSIQKTNYEHNCGNVNCTVVSTSYASTDVNTITIFRHNKTTKSHTLEHAIKENLHRLDTSRLFH